MTDEEVKDRLKQMNQSAQYWLYEDAEVFNTKKNVFRYYPEAMKLQVCLPDYQKNFGTVHGKGVGMDLKALRERPDICQRLIQILSVIYREGTETK